MIIELKWQTIYFSKTVNERKMTGAYIQRKRKKEIRNGGEKDRGNETCWQHIEPNLALNNRFTD